MLFGRIESHFLDINGRVTRQSNQYHNAVIQTRKNCYRASLFPRAVPELNNNDNNDFSNEKQRSDTFTEFSIFTI